MVLDGRFARYSDFEFSDGDEIMPRFYVPQPQIEKGMLRIEGDEVRHIRRVLRLKTGDEIVVFDGSAKEYEGMIV